jgi:hypothetical protein
MGTLTSTSVIRSSDRRTGYSRVEIAHRILLAAGALAAAATVVFLAVYGYGYYSLSLEDRPFAPLHSQLRSSGSIGLRLGELSVVMFVLLFLYPLRKRWQWLLRKGNTRHWLNFHILLGISTPFIVTFHSSFRARGIAGLAYWTMMMVALSGLVGRYVYARIPRGMTAVKLTLSEIEAETEELSRRLTETSLLRREDFAPLLRIPSLQEVHAMSLLGALLAMMRLDLKRPFLVSELRRRALGKPAWFSSLGGFRRSRNRDLEMVLANVKKLSRLRTAMAFLDRTERVFHLWHVIHRPFSISFVAMIAVHIGVALSVGF